MSLSQLPIQKVEQFDNPFFKETRHGWRLENESVLIGVEVDASELLQVRGHTECRIDRIHSISHLNVPLLHLEVRLEGL